MDACFDPNISTTVVSDRNIRWFVCLLIFWSMGFLFPFICPPKSYVRMQALERKRFPEKIKYKFNSHLPSSEIYDYLKRYTAFFSHKTRMYALKPKTFEGKEINVVHIKLPSFYGNEIKGRILVVGGMAGCIWDSVMTAIDLIHKLCEDCHYKHPYTRDYEWYIIPVFNPDGYDYTLSIRNTDELVADPKNTAIVNPESGCRGVALDRNFGFHWGESKQQDYNPLPFDHEQCYVFYAGKYPFSESETIAMKTFIEFQYNISAPITMYLQIHGNDHRDDILYPWRYTARKPFNYRILAKMAAEAARVVHTKMGYWFTQAQSGFRDKASGVMTDWLRGTRHVAYIFTIEPWYKVANESDSPDPNIYIEKAICIIFSLVNSLSNIDLYQNEAESN